jgi:hypothetical protein
MEFENSDGTRTTEYADIAVESKSSQKNLEAGICNMRQRRAYYDGRGTAVLGLTINASGSLMEDRHCWWRPHDSVMAVCGR